jgi:hypothetical protein
MTCPESSRHVPASSVLVRSSQATAEGVIVLEGPVGFPKVQNLANREYCRDGDQDEGGNQEPAQSADPIERLEGA